MVYMARQTVLIGLTYMYMSIGFHTHKSVLVHAFQCGRRIVLALVANQVYIIARQL